jgi:UPF0755 protein
LIHVRKVITVALIATGLAIAVLGAAVWFGWSDLHAPYKGYTGTERFVTIRQGASSGEIGRVLADARVIKQPRLFRAALWWTGQGRNLKAGEYRFDHPVTPLDVVGVLARGEVYTQKLTIPEGLTIEEMAKLYESHGFGRARDFVEAAEDVTRIADLDPAATNLEGYLFPETYALPRNGGAARLVGQMVDRFRTVYGEQMRARAAGQGLTTRQVVTLASIVEKETGKSDERPLVAAVFRNRLKIGMPMQADPTVVYALQRLHRYDGNIRKDDLSMDSAYNTYKYPGLPPGPIASPGKASLEAALAPADARYLYFVSRNDGSHVFATTLTEHSNNVRKFQVQFFREQRQARASSVHPTSASPGAARNTRAPAP